LFQLFVSLLSLVFDILNPLFEHSFTFFNVLRMNFLIIILDNWEDSIWSLSWVSNLNEWMWMRFSCFTGFTVIKIFANWAFVTNTYDWFNVAAITCKAFMNRYVILISKINSLLSFNIIWNFRLVNIEDLSNLLSYLRYG